MFTRFQLPYELSEEERAMKLRRQDKDLVAIAKANPPTIGTVVRWPEGTAELDVKIHATARNVRSLARGSLPSRVTSGLFACRYY